MVAFLAGNIAFYITIEQSDDKTDTLLATLRVILLDGLFLLMGITLGVCILLVCDLYVTVCPLPGCDDFPILPLYW